MENLEVPQPHDQFTNEDSSYLSEETSTELKLDVIEAIPAPELWNYDKTLHLSREGTRLTRRNNESTLNNRIRKTIEQQRFLINMFDATNGRIPKDIRAIAERETGLQWIQIYKWMFDRRQRKKQFNVYRLLEYPVPIFRVINKYGKDVTERRPIFKVEKVGRRSRVPVRAPGKLDAC